LVVSIRGSNVPAFLVKLVSYALNFGRREGLERPPEKPSQLLPAVDLD